MQQETLFRRILRVLRQAVNGEEQDFTTGSIDRSIVLLSIPMILEMAMESLFAVVDIYFVSKINTAATATVGSTESVLTLVYSVAIGLSSAATAMVARRIGEGNRDAAAAAGAQTIVIALILSVLMAVPGLIYAKDILLVMAKDPQVAESGVHFTRIMLVANLPILLLWMLNGIFRGAGDAATAMRALWIANGINLVLDPLFIFGWGPVPALGVTGAAVATTIGRSAGVAYQLWHLFKVGHIIKIKWAQIRPDIELIGRLLRLSAGSTGQYLIGSASWVFLMYLLGQLGAEIQAGYTIAIRIIIFSILPSWGMANAAATLVGQNLGAGHPERAERAAWRAGYFNMLFMAVIGGLYMIFAPFFITLFTQQPETVAAGSMALRVISAGYIFYGYGMILTQAINGAGDTLTPTIMNFVCFWLIEIPLAMLFVWVLDWGQMGVYASIVLAESVLALVAIWVFKRGKWKTTKV